MYVFFLPVQFVVHDLIHVRICELDVIAVGIDEVTEIESIADVHEQTSLSISVSECHFRIQIPVLIGRSSSLIAYDGCVYQVAVTYERHVPQSPETNVSVIRRTARLHRAKGREGEW